MNVAIQILQPHISTRRPTQDDSSAAMDLTSEEDMTSNPAIVRLVSRAIREVVGASNRLVLSAEGAYAIINQELRASSLGQGGASS